MCSACFRYRLVQERDQDFLLGVCINAVTEFMWNLYRYKNPKTTEPLKPHKFLDLQKVSKIPYLLTFKTRLFYVPPINLGWEEPCPGFEYWLRQAAAPAQSKARAEPPPPLGLDGSCCRKWGMWQGKCPGKTVWWGCGGDPGETVQWVDPLCAACGKHG